MRLKALAAGLVVSWATAALAQSAPPVFKFEMHGFASGTVYVQDGALTAANGQGGYLPTPVQPTEDKLSMGADFRQSRFNFSVSGPDVFGGATPRGVFEIDWFGGMGAGNNGQIHLLPRLRIGYAELNWGLHRILFGVNTDLTAALGPVTLAHLGAPYFLTSGNMGFRRPGVFGYHTLGDVKNPNGWKYELAWEIGRAQWTDAAAAVGNLQCAGNVAPGTAAPAGAITGICAGEASGLPALQARVTVNKGSLFSFFVAGHWNKVDRNGAGNIDWQTSGPNSPLTVLGGDAGLKLVYGPVTFAGGGYYGKNLAPLYGGFGTFFFTAGPDIEEYGVWGQAGYNFTKEISAWYFLGMDKMLSDDPTVLAGFGANAPNRNVNSVVMLQYRDGGFAIGAEWVHFRTNFINPAVGEKVVNQVALTGAYFF